MKQGIYIHIPFCKAKCLYCDFNSYAGIEHLQRRYTDALVKEIENSECDREVDSLYIGGGTPTALPIQFLRKILEAVYRKCKLTPDCEITMECNPATMDQAGFALLREASVNRLSIGLQSVDDQILRSLGRIHTFDDFSRSFQAARAVGFENLSLDLMYGLPHQTIKQWQKTLARAVDFHPEHISCYGLKLEEGTPLFAQNPPLPDDDAVRDMYDYAVAYLESCGYRRYEISNFAMPQRESRHNCKYWRCEDYLAFGAGAYSCTESVRASRVRDVLSYCTRIEAGKSAIEAEEKLSVDDRMREFCFLGLRMSDGVSEAEFQKRFGIPIDVIFADAIQKNLSRGTLLRESGRILIPPEFLYVSNSILIDFI